MKAYTFRIDIKTLKSLEDLKVKINSNGGETTVSAEVRQAIKNHLKTNP